MCVLIHISFSFRYDFCDILLYFRSFRHFTQTTASKLVCNLILFYFVLFMLQINYEIWKLKYGFWKKSLWKNATLNSWTLSSSQKGTWNNKSKHLKKPNVMIYYYRYLFVKMKVFNYSELHFSKGTCFKIHTLASNCKQLLLFFAFSGLRLGRVIKTIHSWIKSYTILNLGIIIRNSEPSILQ